MADCPNCEYHKQRAQIWRDEAYRLAGHPLPRKEKSMTHEEYNLLFHREQLNLVAFKRLMDCDKEVLRLVNKAVDAEREACATMSDWILKEGGGTWGDAIRARKQA